MLNMSSQLGFLCLLLSFFGTGSCLRGLGDDISRLKLSIRNAMLVDEPSRSSHVHHNEWGHHHHHHHHHHQDVCDISDWRKKSLKLIKEIPVTGLFEDLKGFTKFEASGMTHWGDGYVMVFDSLETLGFFDKDLEYMGPGNKLVGGTEEESQYEAITPRTRSDTLLVLKEAVQKKVHMHPVVVELKVEADLKNITTIRECTIDFEIEAINKGFESAVYYDGGDKGEFLLGVCEGNYCKGGKVSRQPGNGRMVVAKLDESNGTCTWVTQAMVNIPKSAYFTDYSAMDFRGDRVAITSQEDSAVWIGRINWDTLEFEEDGEVLYFPRSENCQALYCNVEGIHWIDDVRLMATTDRAKANQPWLCAAKDQSVQIFALPHSKRLQPAVLSVE